MFRLLITALVLLCTTATFSQNITLKGKVTDPDDFPLESATVYLTSVKDTTLVDYTITDKNGNWEIKTRVKEEPIDLKISYMGFADYRQRLESITADNDFGTLKMADKATELNEVVVEGEIPPIRVKSDTLEFNAASFKVRPDANVEALLKQLPGVEVSSDGKITVNGKEVNQVLVNGKPFFDENGKIALQNLPAEIIDKIQVSDTKTKQEELSGENASGDNASINLTIQEDKNKGLFGRLMGGYGTDERYESSGMINYFKDKRKISILASSNNINSTGFSMDEIFDSMGGGRNYSIYTTSDGAFNINGMQFGGGSGVTRSNLIGINYSDEWLKDSENSASYFYTQADTENENRTRQTTFLTENETGGAATPGERSITSESTSKSYTDKYAHNFNTRFEFKIDSTATIFFDPQFSRAKSKYRNTDSQTTVNQDNELLNESSGTTYNESDNDAYEGSIWFNKNFSSKKGRYVSGYINTSNRKDDSSNFLQSLTTFYNGEDIDGDGVPDITEDNRNQLRRNIQTEDNYYFQLEYTEPVTDSIKISVSGDYRIRGSVENRDGFDFDEATGGYTDFNSLLTNYLRSDLNDFSPKVGMQLNKSKLNISFDAGVRIADFNNFGSYMGTDYEVNKDYLLPAANFNFRYRFTKSQSTYFYYNYSVDFPNASQILPIEDLSNPLITQTGNPDIDLNKGHYFYANFRDYDYSTRSGYNFYGGGNFYDSRVVSNTFIDESAKRVTTYTNVAGTFNTWFGGYYNKSIKKEAHTFRYSAGINGNINRWKGFTNGGLYAANQYSFNPQGSFTYEYGELLVINPSYEFSYDETHYTNYATDVAYNATHRLMLQTTSYWPKHFVFGNDFSYNYNSNLGSGFRRDFYLWNMSLGYNFMNDNLLFKVKVYDLLNQNTGTSRTVTATSIYDQQNVVLQRYAMFSLTFKFDKFGTKKKDDNDGGSRFWWF
ncbi:outer membrane beta-barrel protein [Flavobacterium sp. D11R37]|uniref:outer membrane beta-barrel protein n=1 Tax=Flavobacterium coralii TaxID=2838017 RepID=UPI001CA6B536|nr:outer membrane beta-barrel protein [Flavobacterium coralii]MBY8962726.1 outer membrane beta-barrel protein [Flavobacterium coralii]